MRLYHFTSLSALIGADILSTLQLNNKEKSVNVAEIASPDSILKAGLRPHHNGKFDFFLMPTRLPECVWLTSNPEMDNRFVTRNTTDGGKWRVTVAIPESDRNLISWPRYLKKKSGFDFTLLVQEAGMTEQDAIITNREMSYFYVYFGSIGTDRFRDVQMR